MSKPESQDVGPPPTFHFEADETLAAWNMPALEYLTKHEKSWTGIATGCVVFNPEGKILVIQRAHKDSAGDKWEIPGGAVDDTDPTILYGAARELWEESGFVALRFSHVVTGGLEQEPGHVFPNSTYTKIFCRFCFHVDVESCETVTLDPKEHQDFKWATEDEVREEKIGKTELPITHPSMRALILEAFRLRKS